jgi:predicted CXXCH cytochrome family protein
LWETTRDGIPAALLRLRRNRTAFIACACGRPAGSVARKRAPTRALLLALLLAPALPAAAETAWVGSAACQSCHADEYRAWQSSHHYQAMLPASEDTVLGDFDGATYQYGGVTSRFYRRDGKYLVETDDANGALREFEIAYTFGFHPLQQYLVPFPNGRYQALNIVWDSRPRADGGQRWMHLYPEHDDPADGDGPVTHDDPVHWTGSFQNWNSRCAACHSTGLEKNYSAASDGYRTSWQEVNVACEACHGPAGAHLAWASAGGKDTQAATGAGPHKGFAFSLADRGAFGPSGTAATNTRQRLDGRRPLTQLETCAACHSRRSEMESGKPGDRYDDHHQLALLEPGLYFADGQVRDEVYVYGSFLQSRMHAAGVVCSNCHEPHSGKVIADDNRLCTQCHAEATFDRPAHHHHAEGSAGAACVNCHMPARSYMVVDDRRDHSFRVPEPRLTAELGIPNACNGCHRDRDAGWAQQALSEWGVANDLRATHAPLLAAAWSGRPEALPGLLSLAADPARPAILRASAALGLGAFPSGEALQGLAQLLGAEDALVRAAAVRALDSLPLQQRYPLLHGLAGDPSRSVRLAAARQLAGVAPDGLPQDEAQALAALLHEYLESMQHNADLPEGQMNLGLYYANIGDPVAAEQAYRRALKLSPAFVPALLNLADLYRANGLDQQAGPLLQRAIDRAPAAAAPQHAMGLLLVRQGNLDAALGHLERATALEPDNARYAYVYGVGLWEAGRSEAAIATLEAALAVHPGDRDLQSALASYRQQPQRP